MSAQYTPEQPEQQDISLQVSFIALVQDRRPYLLFRDRQFLPDVPALYVVLSDAGELLYIGITANLQQRWKDHHRASQMEDHYRIYWRMAESAKERAEHERTFVRTYRPLWNRSEILT